ncbi:DUF2642 domain-containing protein [Priestia megaterium]|uniref:DUF2642 domain-containing protein n=1 Tax=Priestia megaterium TaxID=1404 RepID=UPI001C2155C8|nr:DUF2642 domain-containing protein [Priestia megaterium]MBU8757000.1 YuzF family protein [Priestia megaterium]
MGSNGFSSERKQKRVDLLKQLLNTNISTQGSSNPLEALLSSLDLGSLEDLMQKNKKSHHDDWDSKKKRHHDDCNDHDWDHKKKHDHDDCGCKKKKHDHDDCGCKKKKHDHDDWDHKKKRHHDDCGCDGHKHHKNPCDKCFKHDCCCKDKKKKRCDCNREDTQALRQAINAVCLALNTNDLGDLEDALGVLEPLLDNDCLDEEIVEDLIAIIDDIDFPTPSSATLFALGRQLNKLRRCLGLKVRRCRPGGDDDCTDCGPLFNDIRNAINAVCQELRRDQSFNLADLQAAIRDELLPELTASCISDSVRATVTAAANAVLTGTGTSTELTNLSNSLIDLRICIGVNNPDAPPCVPADTPGGGAPVPSPAPITTIRQRLLDLLADQVVITTPTGLYAGTLVTVQADYIAVVASTGTYLIPIDQIQTFTTE